MTVFIATIINGKINFGSDFNYQRLEEYLKTQEGKKFRFEKMQSEVSSNLRAYYFGAVLPVIRSTCSEWDNLSSEELHEIIKKMLFYFEAYNPITKRIERFGRSVMKKDDFNNTQKAMEFLDIIRDYLVNCGREMPDITEYKAYINMANIA